MKGQPSVILKQQPFIKPPLFSSPPMAQKGLTRHHSKQSSTVVSSSPWVFCFFGGVELRGRIAHNINAMNRELIIREGNIFFQDDVPFHPKLHLKLCSEREIYKFHGFQWKSASRRWEQGTTMRLPWPAANELPLEVYYQEGSAGPEVLGEGAISVATLPSYLDREIRIPLTYDGSYVGCLYCVVSDRQDENHELSKHFLYMHKIEVNMLEHDPHVFRMRVLKNQEPAFEKDFHLKQQSKILFPNIKVPVKMSDVFTIDIVHRSLRIKPIKFVVDSVRRGKTSNYQVWLRNLIKNKVGELKVEYFLENLYLENQRQIFTRKGIVAAKQILQPTLITEQEKDKVRRSVIIRQILEADKRILKLDRSMRKLIRNIQAKEKDKDMEKQKDKENDHMHQSAPAQLREPEPTKAKAPKRLKIKVSLEDRPEDE